MNPMFHDELWLIRLSWLCAQAEAMPRYTADLAKIDAAVKMSKRNNHAPQ